MRNAFRMNEVNETPLDYYILPFLELATDRIKLAEIEGRVSIRLWPYGKFPNSKTDFVLEDGDSLEIPRTPAEIVVTGEVQNSGAFVFERGLTVRDYIHLAGGLTNQAFRRDISLIRADGTASSSRSFVKNAWDGVHLGRARVGDFLDTRVSPGDQIVVPFDYRIKIDNTARTLDILVKALTSFGLVTRVISQD